VCFHVPLQSWGEGTHQIPLLLFVLFPFSSKARVVLTSWLVSVRGKPSLGFGRACLGYLCAIFGEVKLLDVEDMRDPSSCGYCSNFSVFDGWWIVRWIWWNVLLVSQLLKKFQFTHWHCL
jgi:hypothetical protein